MNLVDKILKRKNNNLPSKDTSKSQEEVDNVQSVIEDVHQEQQDEMEKKLEEETIILNKLSQIYNNCDNIEAPNLVSLIQTLDINDYTTNITQKLMDIIAKRTALDCMRHSGPRIYPLNCILSSIDLFEADLPLLTYKEYKKIKVEYDRKGKSYHQLSQSDKRLIRNRLLEDIAQKSAKTFDDIGDFALPKAESFKHLDSEDIHTFISTVKVYSNDADKPTLKRLNRILHGEASTELKDLNRMLEKMKPNDRIIAIQNILDLLRSSQSESKTKPKNELDFLIQNIESSIKSLPSNQQVSTAKIILDTLEQQQESMKMLRNHKSSAHHATTSSHNNGAKGTDR